MPIDATISSASPSSAPTSPNNRLKFLCSHGGKILPRAADGQLKYVGGETRVISVPRDTPFQEVMKRLTYLIDGEMILKYQLLSDDLDALVSVKSDEDLVHMFDEIDHYEAAARMRAFLFPANNPVVMDNHTEPLAPEQRYIYSINGINAKQVASPASPASTSPRSPDSCTEATSTNEPACQNSASSMHKIQSSPSLCNIPQQNSSSHCAQLHHPQYYHNPGYKSPNPPFDANWGAATPPERLVSVRSVGRSDAIRLQMDNVPTQFYCASRENRGGGCCTKAVRRDNCSHFPEIRTLP